MQRSESQQDNTQEQKKVEKRIEVGSIEALVKIAGQNRRFSMKMMFAAETRNYEAACLTRSAINSHWNKSAL